MDSVGCTSSEVPVPGAKRKSPQASRDDHDPLLSRPCGGLGACSRSITEAHCCWERRNGHADDDDGADSAGACRAKAPRTNPRPHGTGADRAAAVPAAGGSLRYESLRACADEALSRQLSSGSSAPRFSPDLDGLAALSLATLPAAPQPSLRPGGARLSSPRQLQRVEQPAAGAWPDLPDDIIKRVRCATLRELRYAALVLCCTGAVWGTCRLPAC